ncbi:cation:dicarboxylate symporter family transporter, partial [Siminovitchia fortis]|uniref:cation:dicarboxylate symporter family transporter n=1 Tax=Siminovitchia fortis TaxID=254758 RepID=UPI0011A8E10B
MREENRVVLVLMVSWKGIGGVGGVWFVVLVGSLGRVGIAVEGVGFMGGIDRVVDMGGRVVKVVGNGLGRVVMCKWEGRF